MGWYFFRNLLVSKSKLCQNDEITSHWSCDTVHRVPLCDCLPDYQIMSLTVWKWLWLAQHSLLHRFSTPPLPPNPILLCRLSIHVYILSDLNLHVCSCDVVFAQKAPCLWSSYSFYNFCDVETYSPYTCFYHLLMKLCSDCFYTRHTHSRMIKICLQTHKGAPQSMFIVCFEEREEGVVSVHLHACMCLCLCVCVCVCVCMCVCEGGGCHTSAYIFRIFYP